MCARHLSWWLSSLFSMLKPSTLSSSLTWLLRVLREGACVQEEEARRNGNRCESVSDWTQSSGTLPSSPSSPITAL